MDNTPIFLTFFHRWLMPNITVNSSTHPQHKDITLISATGFIDTTTAPDFEKTFQRALSEKKYNLIIDLKDVNYISSAGWGIFIAELKRIRAQKGNLFLVSMSPEVTDAFELLEFHTILKSFPTVNEAVQKGFGKVAGVEVQDKKRKGKVTAKTTLEIPSESVPAESISIGTPLPAAEKKQGFFGKMLKSWKFLFS